ncbi:Uncharacterized protein ChrSV_4003 [Chromobacterium vaccinii]|nr:Uncharacterized protein ChrSW_4003 [Chromobacterium vaccinii]QND91460.1 Uncharacterized protein ChrSV_4003 [Chromobacterium vaccinii]
MPFFSAAPVAARPARAAETPPPTKRLETERRGLFSKVGRRGRA